MEDRYEYMETITDVYLNNERSMMFNDLYRKGWRIVGVFASKRRVTTMFERRKEEPSL